MRKLSLSEQTRSILTFGGWSESRNVSIEPFVLKLKEVDLSLNSFAEIILKSFFDLKFENPIQETFFLSFEIFEIFVLSDLDYQLLFNLNNETVCPFAGCNGGILLVSLSGKFLFLDYECTFFLVLDDFNEVLEYALSPVYKTRKKNYLDKTFKVFKTEDFFYGIKNVN